MPIFSAAAAYISSAVAYIKYILKNNTIFTATNQELIIPSSNGYDQISFSLTGTWAGQLQVYGSLGDGQWEVVNTDDSVGNASDIINANGIFAASSSRYQFIKIKAVLGFKLYKLENNSSSIVLICINLSLLFIIAALYF